MRAYVIGTGADYVTCRARRPLQVGGGLCGALVPLPADGSPPNRCPRCGQGLPWHALTRKATR